LTEPPSEAFDREEVVEDGGIENWSKAEIFADHQKWEWEVLRV
jgi:hypothetical protein